VRAAGVRTLQEEIPEAYKDVADVVDVVAGAGIGRKVARLCPVGWSRARSVTVALWVNEQVFARLRKGCIPFRIVRAVRAVIPE